MARIRSIHPGFFTDENLVAVTMAARMLFLGLGVEADDKGIFEWKPLQIKMRIFPADNLEVLPLLLELEAANAIQKYEINGRDYGAIRNFRKYQRPKTPNSTHPITPKIELYVGLFPQKAEINEVDRVPFPQKAEKSPQMEDGGDKMEEVGGNRIENNNTTPLPDSRSKAGLSSIDLEKALRAAAGWEQEPHPGLCVTGVIQSVIEAGASLEHDVLPIVRAIAPKANSRTSWKFFIPAIRQSMNDRASAGKPLAGKSEADRAAKKAAALKMIEENNRPKDLN